MLKVLQVTLWDWLYLKAISVTGDKRSFKTKENIWKHFADTRLNVIKYLFG